MTTLQVDDERASQLIVILDCNPFVWSKYNRSASSLFPNRNLFVDVVDQLTVFLKAYLLCGRQNGLFCIAAHTDQNKVVYKTEYKTSRSETLERAVKRSRDASSTSMSNEANSANKSGTEGMSEEEDIILQVKRGYLNAVLAPPASLVQQGAPSSTSENPKGSPTAASSSSSSVSSSSSSPPSQGEQQDCLLAGALTQAMCMANKAIVRTVSLALH